ncbi:MAG: helix-turn-helix transcriptional regulator [Candidatus Latescibacterota bacterium]
MATQPGASLTHRAVPAFVVIPFADFARAFPAEAEEIQEQSPRVPEGDAVPHEVVVRHVKEGMSSLRAWREYLGLTQAEVAAKAGISQAALSQMASEGTRLRQPTRMKLALALGINPDQLVP